MVEQCQRNAVLAPRLQYKLTSPRAIMARYNFLNGHLNKWAPTKQKISKHCSSKFKFWEKVEVSHLWKKIINFLLFPQRRG